MSDPWYCGDASCTWPPMWLFALLVVGMSLVLGLARAAVILGARLLWVVLEVAAAVFCWWEQRRLVKRLTRR